MCVSACVVTWTLIVCGWDRVTCLGPVCTRGAFAHVEMALCLWPVPALHPWEAA